MVDTRRNRKRGATSTDTRGSIARGSIARDPPARHAVINLAQVGTPAAPGP